ncbi:SAM-dependent methyltransferase [Nitriliruptor alkaliphilus]|uniref:SAM-dependent methyltransferase n=1 Tax=Nitriliruptor alkaliphilus TaxID=427918 RepID=UPI000695CDD7|nr:cyclopropane-fatty-acyl-phospholipid synthase family protein [Nitriliruptor alkaliphilus]
MSRLPLGARLTDAVIDRGLLPDPLLRASIRRLLRARRGAITAGGAEARSQRKRALLRELAEAPLAIHTDEANEQHYEVPTELFELMLGPHLKYSSGYWPETSGELTLADAEEAMLRLTCDHAGLADGQDVLELGCGWGSLTLWMAERYPTSRITAVSNSATQREHIEKQAALRGLDNVRVLTCDVNALGVDAHADVVTPASFDRVVTVEMFEHVRNHGALTGRIATWLRPGGELFVHVFAHRSDPYPFDTGGSGDWMARHFFTGGLMPSDDLLLHAVRDLDVADHWVISGTHYARTLRAWLDNLDTHRDRAIQLLGETYGPRAATAWFHRWRVFDIACEELFAFAGGDEWHVSHYRFLSRPS